MCSEAKGGACGGFAEQSRLCRNLEKLFYKPRQAEHEQGSHKYNSGKAQTESPCSEQEFKEHSAAPGAGCIPG